MDNLLKINDPDVILVLVGSDSSIQSHIDNMKSSQGKVVVFPKISFKEVFPDIQDSDITNLSGNGAGNFYIAGRLFEYISHNKKPDYIFFKFISL